MRAYYIYIITNKYNGTLYIGVTSDLKKRIWEHKNKVMKGFSAKYNVNQLVYFEEYDDINSAIYREKCLKEWKREKKLNLITENNPDWNDLYEELI
jgi:putative endonuclease